MKVTKKGEEELKNISRSSKKGQADSEGNREHDFKQNRTAEKNTCGQP